MITHTKPCTINNNNDLLNLVDKDKIRFRVEGGVGRGLPLDNPVFPGKIILWQNIARVQHPWSYEITGGTHTNIYEK